MKFKNTGEITKIRLKEENGYRWQTVKAGEEVELSEEVGLINKFEKVEVKIEKPTEKPKSKRSK